MRIGLVLAILGVLAAHASAQVYDDPETEEALKALERDRSQPPPTELGEQAEVAEPVPPPPVVRAPSLALRRGQLAVTITAEASLSKGTAFEPTSIAPDVSYGVTDKLTLSVLHSGFAMTGFRGSAGGGICVTGADRGCPEVYDNAGVEALVDLVRGDFMAAGVVGMHALSFDPLALDAKVGMQTSYRAGRLTATFSPSVLVGVTERDAGNKGGVFLPASIGAQVHRSLFLALGGGWAAPLADVGDGWTARLGVIGRIRVTRSAFVAASLFVPRLAGGDAVMATGADTRTANLWLTYLR